MQSHSLSIVLVIYYFIITHRTTGVKGSKSE